MVAPSDNCFFLTNSSYEGPGCRVLTPKLVESDTIQAIEIFTKIIDRHYSDLSKAHKGLLTQYVDLISTATSLLNLRDQIKAVRELHALDSFIDYSLETECEIPDTKKLIEKYLNLQLQLHLRIDETIAKEEYLAQIRKNPCSYMQRERAFNLNKMIETYQLLSNKEKMIECALKAEQIFANLASDNLLSDQAGFVRIDNLDTLKSCTVKSEDEDYKSNSG